MISKREKQSVHEAGPTNTNAAGNGVVMYGSVTAPCRFFGFGLSSAGPLAAEREFLEAGLWRCSSLHSDLIAPVENIQTSQ